VDGGGAGRLTCSEATLPSYKPGYAINSEAFPGAAAHIWLIQNKHAKKLGKSPMTPLHYLPSKARNAPGQETENKLDNGKPGNRKAVCGRAFRKHNDTATIATPNGNADPISCASSRSRRRTSHPDSLPPTAA
jgi:hypothetical protein